MNAASPLADAEPSALAAPPRRRHAPAWSRLLVVVGPSGAGKDTVLRRWRERLGADPRIDFLQRWITRPADPAGEAHHPVSADEFAALRDGDHLAFHWTAHGLHYGVPRERLARLQRGGWAVLNGSRQHLAALRAQAPGCRVVEITAPAPLLEQRLAGRAREDATAVLARLQRRTPPAAAELRLVNDGAVDDCVEALHRWWLGLAA